MIENIAMNLDAIRAKERIASSDIGRDGIGEPEFGIHADGISTHEANAKTMIFGLCCCGQDGCEKAQAEEDFFHVAMYDGCEDLSSVMTQVLARLFENWMLKNLVGREI